MRMFLWNDSNPQVGGIHCFIEQFLAEQSLCDYPFDLAKLCDWLETEIAHHFLSQSQVTVFACSDWPEQVLLSFSIWFIRTKRTVTMRRKSSSEHACELPTRVNGNLCISFCCRLVGFRLCLYSR